LNSHGVQQDWNGKHGGKPEFLFEYIRAVAFMLIVIREFFWLRMAGVNLTIFRRCWIARSLCHVSPFMNILTIFIIPRLSLADIELAAVEDEIQKICELPDEA
jgi:hypothetical protein